MQDFGSAFYLAFELIWEADAGLLEIILLSLYVSLTAAVIAGFLGLIVGALLAVARFRGRLAIVVFLNALMGLPPVVIGLCVYMVLSNAGPLGWLKLLYSPGAMIIAQVILVMPIVAGLSRQVLEDLYSEYSELFLSIGVSRLRAIQTLLWDARYSLVTVVLAGFGRAIAEVGAVIIVGGNIKHVTRVMTTAIALETSKGALALALALGMILICISLGVNFSAYLLRNKVAGSRHA